MEKDKLEALIERLKKKGTMEIVSETTAKILFHSGFAFKREEYTDPGSNVREVDFYAASAETVFGREGWEFSNVSM